MSPSSSPSLPDGYAACHAVIGDAINRCRFGESMSRVTIAIKHLEDNPPTLLSSFEVSVSDTGAGISGEYMFKLFQCFLSSHLEHLCSPTLFWGGELAVISTKFMEKDIRQYRVEDAFQKPRIMQLRSLPKENGNYSGTSITFQFKGYPEKLLLYIRNICCKMEVLMMKHVAVEVFVAKPALGGFTCEDVLLLSEGLKLHSEISNLERLGIGLSIHARKGLDGHKGSHSKGERTKSSIGKASAASSESTIETLWFFEACFAVTEAVDMGDVCSDMGHVKTKVLFFQDFICSSIPPLILHILERKISWDRFGLKIKAAELDGYGTAVIEWETCSKLGSIELALHKYKTSPAKTDSWAREVNLLKKAVEGALNDLKQQSPHLFLSDRCFEVRKYVPDLSSCISGLISSSSDVSFKASCAAILGLNATDFEAVDTCIKSRLLEVIEDLDKQAAQDVINQRTRSNKVDLKCDLVANSSADDEDVADGYESSESASMLDYCL